MATIDDALVSIAQADADVTGLIGAGSSIRFFPGFVPQGEEFPQACYLVVSSPTDHHLTGPSNPRRVRLQITAWARTHAGAAALARVLCDAFNLYGGTIAGIEVTNIRVADEGGDIPSASPSNEPQRLFGRRQDYRV